MYPNKGKDNLEKIYAKVNEGILIRYSTPSKNFRVFKKIILTIKELVHITFC